MYSHFILPHLPATKSYVERDNVNVHRAAANIMQAGKATRPAAYGHPASLMLSAAGAGPKLGASRQQFKSHAAKKQIL